MKRMGRMADLCYLIIAVVCCAGVSLPAEASADAESAHRPNIIVCMSDDQGWGDVGYNGHSVLKTPRLDQMARDGVRFERFYAAAPVCSPTRGSCLTGRHPHRYGVTYANVGHLKAQEITLAEVLKPLGYATGHFGKWHLGTLTNDMNDGRRGGKQKDHYSPPWVNGFDECFSTEQAVPTWNPAQDQPIRTRFWTGPGEWETANLDGDSSRVIMDRVIPFITKAAKADKRFLAVVWFHTPHEIVRSGPPYTEMYAEHEHYYGSITAMDEQLGRLREELVALDIQDNTMLWFCSDNGPEHSDSGPGTTGGLRGRKRSLYEGGVRVPGLLVWPQGVREPCTVLAPCSTSDYFPTILDALGLPVPSNRPYDGISLMPLVRGEINERPTPIAFESKDQVALIDNRYKLYSGNGGEQYELYDLIADPSEQMNIAREHPAVVTRMRQSLANWRDSCTASSIGADY